MTPTTWRARATPRTWRSSRSRWNGALKPSPRCGAIAFVHAGQARSQTRRSFSPTPLPRHDGLWHARVRAYGGTTMHFWSTGLVARGLHPPVPSCKRHTARRLRSRSRMSASRRVPVPILACCHARVQTWPACARRPHLLRLNPPSLLLCASAHPPLMDAGGGGGIKGCQGRPGTGGGRSADPDRAPPLRWTLIRSNRDEGSGAGLEIGLCGGAGVHTGSCCGEMDDR